MYNFDELSTAEIKKMIADGLITNEDVIEFYGNEWWDEEML